MKPISVGDMVVVIRPPSCCKGVAALGSVFTVESLSPAPAPWCRVCGVKRDGAGLELRNSRIHGWLEAYRVKRIPPLDELEASKETNKLDVREPA